MKNAGNKGGTIINKKLKIISRVHEQFMEC